MWHEVYAANIHAQLAREYSGSIGGTGIVSTMPHRVGEGHCCKEPTCQEMEEALTVFS